MKSVNTDFFYQATLHICGTLDINSMLNNCLAFIRDFIPAQCIGLHIYDRNTKLLEDFSFAGETGLLDAAGYDPLAMRPNKELADYLDALRDKDPHHPCFIINDLSRDPLGQFITYNDQIPEISYVFSLLELDKDRTGAVSLVAEGNGRYSMADLTHLNQLKVPFTISLSNALKHRELLRLKEQLADDNRFLNRQLYHLAGDEVIGQQFGLRDVMEMVRQVAPLSSRVLLLGETGTGKEIIANTIHQFSSRAEGPFIKVNCGAIPEGLIDSELFGHEKGAFTGATARKRGRFERAHKGTLFLDEIGELPLQAQVRLLRVIQTGEIERVGGVTPVPVDIRIIAATHRDLPEMIRQKKFREDLWFRLNVFPITIPPLRHRPIDIPELADFFISKKIRELNLDFERRIASGTMDALQSYHWPGNVRELENLVERALIRSVTDPPGSYLRFDIPTQKIALPDEGKASQAGPASPPLPPLVLNLDKAMKQHIQTVLDLKQGRIRGENGAAKALGIPPSTLRHRMDRLGILYGRQAKKKVSALIRNRVRPSSGLAGMDA